jgi:hypothetical protein
MTPVPGMLTEMEFSIMGQASLFAYQGRLTFLANISSYALKKINTQKKVVYTFKRRKSC